MKGLVALDCLGVFFGWKVSLGIPSEEMCTLCVCACVCACVRVCVCFSLGLEGWG